MFSCQTLVTCWIVTRSGVDVVFHPYNLSDYGNEIKNGESEVEGNNGLVSWIEKTGMGHETWIRVEKLGKGLCGKSMPIFLRGVATIVSELFNIVEPDVAVFRKKDYQQWRDIQRMIRILTNPSSFVQILEGVIKERKTCG